MATPQLGYFLQTSYGGTIAQYGCALCCVTSAAYNWDRTVTVEYMKSKYWTDANGLTQWGDLVLPNGHKMSVSLSSGINYTTLRSTVNAGKPFIIHITDPSNTSNEHYVVAYSYGGAGSSPSEINVFDPVLGWTNLQGSINRKSQTNINRSGPCSYV